MDVLKRRIPVVLAAVCVAFLANAQLLTTAALDTVRTYHSLERALQEPDKVFRLDLSKSKLKEVPDLRMFKNLNALDLSQNKLKSLPTWFGELKFMQ
ncbi:MAG TPA: hypothetical protein PK760_12130, partial [Flavobacteriales bacterium]|nr:hypothetical protein [Flavobacteriales bacterium]